MKQAESSHHPLPPPAGKDSEHICIKRKYLIWFLLVSPVLIILLLVLEHHFIPQITHLPYPTSISEFANQFILASTLFTGLAFSGLVITILLQYTQCKQLSEQQYLMNRQMFENSFYNQLHHLHNLPIIPKSLFTGIAGLPTWKQDMKHSPICSMSFSPSA